MSGPLSTTWSAIRNALLTLVVCAAPAWAQNGAIAGTVTRALDGSPVALAPVRVYSSSGALVQNTQAGADGTYSVSLGAGSYFVRTAAYGIGLNLVDEVYDNIPCGPACSVTAGTPVSVTAGVTHGGIDFALDAGASISGTVVDAATSSPLGAVPVRIVTPAGTTVTTVNTNGSGAYAAVGLRAGSYYARTAVTSSQNYQDELYNNVDCPFTCSLASGTAIAVGSAAAVTGIDFSLAGGGTLSGTVRAAATSSPISGISVRIYDATGAQVKSASSNGAGVFTVLGLPSGTYYAATVVTAAQLYVNELYNEIACFPSCTVTTGTPIAVTTGAITSNVDFTLSSSGSITGTITDAVTATPISGVPVQIYTSDNAFVAAVSSNASGVFTASGLPEGTYFARALPGSSLNYLSELYDELPCPANCSLQGATPIAVTAGAATTGVNFTLTPGGSITGQVTDGVTHAPLANVFVGVYTTAGQSAGSATTNSGGVFTVLGLASGSYVARTNVSASLNYIDEAYDGISCPSHEVCDLSTFTPIPVTAGAVTSGIDFALSAGGTIAGTVTSANGGAPLAGVEMSVISASTQATYSAITNGAGSWSVIQLPVGTYFATASVPPGMNYIGELYDDKPCVPCDPKTGTPIQIAGPGVTMSGVNFALGTGGTITGTVTATGTGSGISGVTVQAYAADGTHVRWASTDGTGAYVLSGLPTGSFYIRTAASYQNFVDEVFDNVTCVPCSVTSGAPVSVTAGGTTSGIDFSLAQGGQISGVVTDAVSHAPLSSVEVDVFSADGTFLEDQYTYTGSNGTFTIRGLATGVYFVSAFCDGCSSSVYYVPELYADKSFPEPLEFPTPPVGDAVPPLLNVTAGDPVNVVAGAITSGVDFALGRGGRVTGTVTDASTGSPISAVLVKVYRTDGGFVSSGYTDNFGNYEVLGVPTGSYVVRAGAIGSLNYVPELYDGLACAACDVTTGTPVNVTTGATTAGIDFSLAPNLVQNGSFGAGTTGWKLYGAPNDSYMTWNTTGGSFNLRRTPQPAGTPVSQALLFQDTGIAVPTDTPVVAQFDLANTASKVMVMRVLLVGNSANFGLDFAACTFALPNDGVFRTYQMKAHATTAWPNAAVYFYAGQIDPNGGDYYYKVDNVSLALAPGQSIERTECVDPLAPAAAGGADSANLLVNGDFSAGMANWGEDGAIVRRDPMVGGVYEAYRTAVFRPPVVLQKTNPALQPGGMLPAGQRLTLTLRLGNTL
ncbi:MAG: carboxypeptidase regulatory-like domain-containing protein, partial [Acidobacteria bacterium]|nr:carboxypeptidase regulatory-like domain-containing protein [Acidobacteriota bacterium]